MRKKVALALLVIMTSATAASAMTFEGTVEKADVVKKRGFWERLFNRREEQEGRIGVRISTSGTIDFVHPGSPAERAGLQATDYVVTVDGRKHNVENISGEPGTTVHLEVKRKSERFAVDVQRVDYRDIAQ